MTTTHREKDIERFDKWASTYEQSWAQRAFLIQHIKPRLLWQQGSSSSLQASLMLAVAQASCYVKPGPTGRKRT